MQAQADIIEQPHPNSAQSAAPSRLRKPVKRLQPDKPVVECGKKLSIEFGQRMMIELLGDGLRMWGEVTVVRKGRFIGLSIPQMFKYKKNIINESMVAVRALSNGNCMCGFRTTIMSVLEYPDQLLFISYPEKYEKLNLRKEKRVSCFAPASVVYAGEETDGALVNLSPGGAQVVASATAPLAQVSQDETLFLVFSLHQSDQAACAKCLVRSVQKNSGKVRLGLQFAALIGKTKNAVAEYIMEVQQYTAV